MALKINNLKLPAIHTEDDIRLAAAKALRISTGEIAQLKKLKCSLDARKKDNLHYIYSVAVTVRDERGVLKRLHGKPSAGLYTEKHYSFEPAGTEAADGAIAVVGCGPAGLFCAYELARSGYSVMLFERGGCIEDRVRAVDEFWQTGKLNVSTNVQFGEGGAGTFSDGKLGTAVRDDSGRIAHVLETFVKFGAPDEILYKNKPHIGTDLLKQVVRNMRRCLEELGCEVRFNAELTDVIFEDSVCRGIIINNTEKIHCKAVVLAIGHSARDTFYMLRGRGVYMEPKPFAVGVRVEHPQELIGLAQYGEMYGRLPAADYKLTYRCGDGRGVYSFCMCPGGFVVNASSEENMLVVNGMSNSARDEAYANSAIVVTVNPADFGGSSDRPLEGVEFQRGLERLAFRAGEGGIPVQLYTDFRDNRACTGLHSHIPNTKGAYKEADLRKVLPDFICRDIIEAMGSFGRSIRGFDGADALLLGVETRTSSPVRITRGDSLASISHRNLYPCGEGAGYAGGITSSAVDGIKVYEAIASRFAPEP